MHQIDSCSLDSCCVGLAIDGMCVGMIITNAAGRVMWLNRSAERILGIEKEASLGRLLGQVLRDPGMTGFWHRAEAADTTLLGEVKLLWPQERALKVNAAPSLDADGNRVANVLLFCDVSAEQQVRIELSQEATQRLMELADRMQPADRTDPQGGLTAQELRILRLVGVGLGNEEIAREIHVAPSTVRTHLKHVYAKLGLSSRAEAIRYALRHQLAHD
ncbi:MAG: PAS domain-containing protein [Planctomycetes bacterium]|nr:PAS domain-containing protein [Planctomycetota bacterium]